jgi:hypothetical protein
MATAAHVDVVEDAAQIADNLGLRWRFTEKATQAGLSRQVTVYGANYDGTDRSGKRRKVADKVRITDKPGPTAEALSLTGNNARVSLTTFEDEDREAVTEALIEILGEVA